MDEMHKTRISVHGRFHVDGLTERNLIEVMKESLRSSGFVDVTVVVHHEKKGEIVCKACLNGQEETDAWLKKTVPSAKKIEAELFEDMALKLLGR